MQNLGNRDRGNEAQPVQRTSHYSFSEIRKLFLDIYQKVSYKQNNKDKTWNKYHKAHCVVRCQDIKMKMNSAYSPSKENIVQEI